MILDNKNLYDHIKGSAHTLSLFRFIFYLFLIIGCTKYTATAQHKIIYGDTIHMRQTKLIGDDPNDFVEGYELREHQLDGKWLVYFKDEPTKLWLEANLDHGKRVGKWEYWRKNGNREKQIYYDQGGNKFQLVLWNSNGNKEIETMYYKDYFNGPLISWYDNGQMKSVSNFVSHKPNGIFIKWYTTGHKESEKFYENGVPARVWKFWSEDGRLLKQQVYKDGKVVREDSF